MNKQPMFQIVMPIFQSSNIFNLCMDSLIQSITMPTHLILIDDGSPPETQNAIARFAASSKPSIRFTVRRHSSSWGCPRSINEGLSLTDSEGYTVFADSDVIFTNGWQEKVHAQFQDDSSTGGIGGVLLYPQTGGIQNCGISYQNYLACHIFLNNDTHCLDGMGCYPVQATVFAFFAARSELVKRTGLMDTGYFNGYEDIDFQIRLRNLGYQIKINPQIILYHWEKSNGIHRTFSRKQNLGRFWSRNHKEIYNDFLDYLLPQIRRLSSGESTYIGIDMSESRNNAGDIWVALQRELSIKQIKDISSGCSAREKLWLPELLSSDFFSVQAPLIFLCDNFTQLTENRYWFGQRLQYCQDDLVVDLYANVLPTRNLESYCWPGSKIR